MKLTATYKGLIAGTLMVLVSFGIYAAKGNFENNLQYITYGIYVGAIVWALYDYHQSAGENKRFKNYFTQGFKCFIVIVFVMVLFTYFFSVMHPELKEEMAGKYRADLALQKNYTPAEIDKMVDTARGYFNVMLVSMAIFGYLIIGAMTTVVAGLIMMRKKR
jgi:hypothetical protein